MEQVGEQFSFTCAGGACCLQRHQTVNAFVDGFINRAHTAVAEFADYAVSILENGVGRKHDSLRPDN